MLSKLSMIQGRLPVSRRPIVLVLTLLGAIFLLTQFNKDDEIVLQPEQLGLGKYKGARKALPNSVYKKTATILKRNRGNDQNTKSQYEIDWEEGRISRVEMCRTMIHEIYNIGINNKPHVLSSPMKNFASVAAMAESIRLYNFCFIDGNINSFELYGQENNAGATVLLNDFFPFLKAHTDGEHMWPEVTHLNKDKIILPNFDLEAVDTFNANFWINWKKHARGRGIVVTFKEEEANMMMKLIAVLGHLKNRLPIQIVIQGNKFGSRTIEMLKEKAIEKKQQIYIVDATKLLMEKYAEVHIQGYTNKWIASIFNTFEEFILLDVDTVPFINPKKFFEKKGYRTTGFYMYQDRNLVNEKLGRKCVDIISGAQLSGYEARVLNTGFLYSPYFAREDDYTTASARAYYKLFNNWTLHQAESVLVVINKKQKLGGLLMSFMLNTQIALKQCFLGDKEFFWIGQLMNNSPYYIDERPATIVGPLSSPTDEQSNYYKICSAQLGHLGEDGKLDWVNGGMQVCKFKNAAMKDFTDDPEFFKSRHKDAAVLQNFYDSTVTLDGYMTADPPSCQWMNIRECQKYMYCIICDKKPSLGTAAPGDMTPSVQFTDKYHAQVNDIARIWSEESTSDTNAFGV
ncbi:uncharacterized protein GVI51_C03685 [Nakaseomyces glabratus]|uniref:Alpha-1,3-mannosyltransferase MNT3 n=1 Tax=Candida glabrata (strain ATCC 2001 / BCRC 20586 / JCM 3761 / NBRC 0622 / NRRL Y-65 / CBS 138) TaxID=284593 RepID=Q6FWP9_CANGA|nr:uncharacterized protein CAGL0C03894g [Nakaseomyces glabratus]QHS64974.1 uncharacterized protein GVI51_C03685 [Nakaseomyces glabratus]CAG58251.1 unnamed protein product [Nakaseomyces glabratus]|eukprot:XP_445345.1 uncharacterized protein CAGL0C03894g [[Candida] glabrata]